MKAKKATMTDVAKAAGVSQSAVSMILGGKNLSSFPPATVSRVQSVCQSLNYVPRRRARLQSTNSHEILILATKITNPYYPAMIQRIEREAMKYDLRVVACATYSQPDTEQAYLKMATERGFLAALFLYAPINIDAVKKYGLLLPVIAVCDNTSGVPADLVEQNDIHAGQIAAAHLLSLGHRKIAYLANDIDRNYARGARLVGIRQEMDKYAGQCELSVFGNRSITLDDMMDEDHDYHAGYQMAQSPALYAKGITAIIAVNDTLSLGVMDALLEKGYAIPDDFSVMCFNNLLYTGLSRISLTTVDNHADLLAQSAINVLLHRINLSSETQPLVAEAHFKIECQPRLIIRSSTSAPKETP